MWSLSRRCATLLRSNGSLCRLIHTDLKQDNRYGRVEDADISYFQQLLGEGGVINDKDKLHAYNSDWMKKYTGQSRLVLRPKTTSQVSEILSYCTLKRLAVVPQGGNTGLVGGSVPAFDEVVLSTSSMNRVLSFDMVSGAVVCQAGCVLQALDEEAGKHGFMMPLDLGSKGSCQVGGNVSTNAGGLRLLRYGSLHGSVLGVEVVLADGTILDLLRTLRKDNTGYDLKQLFIGAEGTLGIVTAVAVQCVPRPASVQVVFLACESYAAVTRVLASARRMLAEILSAAEFMDAACMDIVTQHLDGASNPLAPSTSAASSSGSSAAAKGASQAPFYVLLETQGSNAKHDVEKLDAFLEAVMSEGHVLDGTVSQSEAQQKAIWHVREGISLALNQRGAVYKYDLSMPVSDMYGLVEEVRARLEDTSIPGVQVVGYGHIGDGNLHLNVSVPSGPSQEVLDRIEPFVYEWTTARRGSISAEHGIGRMKVGALHYSKPPEAIEAMWRLKQMFDPHMTLNPYKVLPPPGMVNTCSMRSQNAYCVL